MGVRVVETYVLVGAPDVVDEVRRSCRDDTIVREIEDVTNEVRTIRGAVVDAAILVLTEGKASALAALAAGADEALEAALVSPEMIAMALRLARERVRQRAFNEEVRRTLAHRERLAALGTVVAGVAHEVSGPAAAVRVNLEMISKAVTDVRTRLDGIVAAPHATVDQMRESVSSLMRRFDHYELPMALEDAVDSLRTIIDVVRDLKGASRSVDEMPPEVVDLRRVVEQVARLTMVHAVEKAHVEFDFPDDVPLLWLPRTRVVQIITNLVANAAWAMRQVRRPLHRLRIGLRRDDTCLMLAVSDTGIGLHPDHLARVFEPFFTLNSASGTGLGLSMSREIVRALGGELTLDSVEGEGTTAMMFLPLALQTSATTERTSVRQRPRVLLVDADVSRLSQASGLLRQRMDLAIARSGIEALDTLASGAHVDAIVCGDVVPDIDGYALHEEVRVRYPDLARRFVVMSTAVRETPSGVDFERRTGCPVVRAPDTGTLVKAVSRAVETLTTLR